MGARKIMLTKRNIIHHESAFYYYFFSARSFILSCGQLRDRVPLGGAPVGPSRVQGALRRHRAAQVAFPTKKYLKNHSKKCKFEFRFLRDLPARFKAARRMAQFEDVPGPFVVDTMENGAARAYAAIPGKKFSPDFFFLFFFSGSRLILDFFFFLCHRGTLAKKSQI